MRRSLDCLAVAVLLLALGSSARAGDDAARPSTDDANTQVRSLFREAYTAYNAHNYQESRDLLQRAWAIRPTYDVASALAQSEMKLQLYREAASHLQACLDTLAPSASEQTFEAIKQAFAEAKAHVGALRVSTDDGVSIKVDGQVVGTAPLQSPVFVDPGSHEVVFSQGSDNATKTVQVEAGADALVEGRVEHVAPPEPVAPVAPAVKPPPVVAVPAPTGYERRDHLYPAIIGGASLAVGLGMAIGFRMAADANDSHADELRQRVGPNGCAAGMPPNPDCAELMDTAKSKDRNRDWSTAGIVLSVMTLAAVPVYWYWPRISRTGATDTGGVRVSGAVGTNFSGVAVAGGF
jgi:hypothetical protein